LGHLLDYEEVLAIYRDLGIDRVELGFVGEYEGDIGTLVEVYDFKFICHNYFLPGDGRIINLASADEGTRAWSLEYVERALQFCANHSIGRYTLHGGFRVDPTADLKFDGPPAAYVEAFERFTKSIEWLAPVADRLGVVLGIENNVVEPHHLDGG
jgi:sugar phosphate isomerase/epimerase